MVLNMRSLAHHSVTLTVHPPLSSSHAPAPKSSWSDAELVKEAGLAIRRELRQLLEKDVVDRLVSMRMRRLVVDHKYNAPTVKNKAVAVTAEGKPGAADAPLFGAAAGLKSLSFKKANKRVREEAKPAAPMPDTEVEVGAGAETEEKPIEQTDVVSPPKKRKKEARSVVAKIESDEEQEEPEQLPPASVPGAVPAAVEERKRALVKESEENEPPVKKTKTEVAGEKESVETIETPVPILSAKRSQPVAEVKKESKVKARPVKKADAETPIDHIVLPDDYDYEALQLPSFTSHPIDPLCRHPSRLSSGLNPDSQPQPQIHMNLDFVKMTRTCTLLVLLLQSLWALLFQTSRQRQDQLLILNLPLPSACIRLALLGRKATTRSHMRRSPHMLHSMRPVVLPPTPVNHKHSNPSP